MSNSFQRVGVVGAGTMGAGIAGRVASAGVEVVLLDTDTATAVAARDAMTTKQPALVMQASDATLVRAGSVTTDADQLASCDWIVEAVPEREADKATALGMIEAERRPGSVVSSNTSTMPLSTITQLAPTTLAPDLVVTHFFNPVRYLPLVELVAADTTAAGAIDRLTVFLDLQLGRRVIRCHDTPGFIANRFAAVWIAAAISEAVTRRLSVEEADLVMSSPIGAPATGVFGLLDLVGLDQHLEVAQMLRRHLPDDDPLRALPRHDHLLEGMIRAGRRGRTSGGGFYRRAGTDRLVLDLVSRTYRPLRQPVLDATTGSGLDGLLEQDTPLGGFAWAVLAATLSYAAWLVPEVTDSVARFDDAVEAGYGWRQGPFRLMDELGPARIADRLHRDGRLVPPLLASAAAAGGFYRRADSGEQELVIDATWRSAGSGRPRRLRDVRRAGDPLIHNRSASLWDAGDGVACLEFHSKQNTIDSLILHVIREAVDRVASGFRGLVIHNEAERFSLGANLEFVLYRANIAAASQLESFTRAGQQAFAALQAAPFPVVGAPSGLALGGGLEVLLHCDGVQAHAEAQLGLVESSIGLVPGWGGCARMLERSFARPPAGGPMPPIGRVFDTIAAGRVSTCAADARRLGYLRPTDRVTNNRDRLLGDACRFVRELADGYAPPAPVALTLPGPSGHVALMLTVDAQERRGAATSHDRLVASQLAWVLTGGDAANLAEPRPISDLLALERTANARLMRTEATLERIEHTLTTGKPLRN